MRKQASNNYNIIALLISNNCSNRSSKFNVIVAYIGRERVGKQSIIIDHNVIQFL